MINLSKLDRVFIIESIVNVLFVCSILLVCFTFIAANILYMCLYLVVVFVLVGICRNNLYEIRNYKEQLDKLK